MKQMERLVQAFVEALAADEGTPQSTIAAYGADVRQFVRFLAQREVANTSVISTDDMQAFCAWLKDQGYADATLARRVTSLRAFGAFLVRTGQAASNPGDGLEPPARRRVERVALTAEQLQQLCNQPLSVQTAEGWRDCALLHVLIATGLRASDLAALDVTDLDLVQGRIILKDGRMHELAADVVMALATYLTLSRPALLHGNTTETALFLNQRGQRITRQGCWLIVKHHARDLGLAHVSLEHLRLQPFAA